MSLKISSAYRMIIGAALVAASPAHADVRLESPDGRVCAEFSLTGSGNLEYTVAIDGHPVVEPSRIGILVDGVDLGTGVDLGGAVYGEIDETYPRRGVKSRAINHARTLRLDISHASSRKKLQLEARAYNDGIAWRLIVPGDGARRVDGESSEWKLPAGARVWFAERNSAWKLKTYAGEWISVDADVLPTVSQQGPVQGPPLVVELPAPKVFAILTEAGLTHYSGMRLRAMGERRLRADFTEGDAGFQITGAITTPWRVTLLARNVDGLVNSDLIENLNAAPDPTLFRDTSYIRPGRSVWRWWSVGTGTPAEERQFIDYAAELGFEFTMVDDGWANWPDAWREIHELAAYGRTKGVGVVIWSDVKDLRSPANNWRSLRDFLDRARDAGVAAVKLDFINSESRESVDFQRAALRLAAERRLMVNFHGIQKPTGEPRTYPNEITREGIRGLELNKIMTEAVIPAAHNAALPFTRLAIGHGDYTPLGYSRPGDTTWAHQLATVVQFTSPMQVIGEHPEMLLHDPATRPALDVLKAVPACWDETRVLAPSKIGELSVIARRTGSNWFLSALSGKQPANLDALDLSFLGSGSFHLVSITSPQPHSLSRRELPGVNQETTLPLEIGAADGAVFWFRAINE